jgi:hypothetical protein
VGALLDTSEEDKAMGMQKPPAKVSDDARPQIEAEERASTLVEVLKLNGDLRANYGVVVGAYLLNRSINAAAGRRPFWWTGWIASGIAGLTWLHSHGWLPFSWLMSIFWAQR